MIARSARIPVIGKLLVILEMIKFEHTIFAMPFALSAALVAAGGLPEWRVLGWIVVAMVGARSAAMAFNRIADARIDSENPAHGITGDSQRGSVDDGGVGIHHRVRRHARNRRISTQ